MLGSNGALVARVIGVEGLIKLTTYYEDAGPEKDC